MAPKRIENWDYINPSRLKNCDKLLRLMPVALVVVHLLLLLHWVTSSPQELTKRAE